MCNFNEDIIMQVVIVLFFGCCDEWLCMVMMSFVQYLYLFVCEMKFIEVEWQVVIGFLMVVGCIIDDKCQEFILLFDVFGLLMFVIVQNYVKLVGCMEVIVFGLFYVDGSFEFGMFDDIVNGVCGELCFVLGQVCGIDGMLVVYVLLEVW